MSVRDSLGNVLCCHGRPFACIECGEEYAREIDAPPRHLIECQWYLDDIGGESVWETQCGHQFEFTNDGPKENEFRFCCYCGHELVVVLHSEEVKP